MASREDWEDIVIKLIKNIHEGMTIHTDEILKLRERVKVLEGSK